MTIVRPGPSPAAPVGEAMRAPFLERRVVRAGRVVDEVEQRIDAVGETAGSDGVLRCGARTREQCSEECTFFEPRATEAGNRVVPASNRHLKPYGHWAYTPRR